MALDKNTIGQFITPHGKGEGGGGTTIVMNNGKNGSLPADINVSSINATSGNISNLTGRSMTFNDAQFIYLASENGAITKLSGADLQYVNGKISSLTSDSITTGKLKATEAEIDKAQIKDILSTNITTDYLTVTKQAHFFELIIDKIKSVGGQIILTPASCVADYVEPVVNNNNTIAYDVWFRADNDEGREITNDWEINDQAICQNFNNATAGVNQNIQNKYYWRLVTAILEDQWVNLRTGEKLSTDQTNPNDTAVTINSFSIGAYDGNTDETANFNHTYFNIAAQHVDKVQMAEWTAGTDTVGTMKTYDTIFGIQITPKTNETGADSNVAVYTVVPNSFKMITPGMTNLNVGIYYADDTSQYFPVSGTWLDSENNETNDPTKAVATKYEFELNTNAPIEAIFINNSDEPNWHLCHGIRLGNDNSDTDNPQVDVNYLPYGPTPSVPEIGDNIIQLGYRYGANATQDEIRRASAIIIASYHTPDTGINPPSYAQYKKITDFNLTSHRHTYFDADGSKFYGNFYVGPDDADPGDYTPISDLEAEVYKIIPNYDLITKDVNGTITPANLICQFMLPNEANLSNVVPTGCTFKYWIDNGSATTISAGNTVSINTSSITNRIILQLLKDNTIVDQITKSIVNIDVANGKSGSYTQWIYRYLPKTTTSVDLTYPDGADKSQIPEYWSETQPESRPTNTYLWYATRLVTYDQNNQPDYSDPWVAARLQGADGAQGHPGLDGTNGLDGTDFEFIYKPFAGPQSASDFTGSYNPANWKGTQGDAYDVNGYVGPGTGAQGTGYKWYDHPQGVSTSYPYEYMSQRTSYTGEDGKEWNSFTNPVLWSKYGENGMDGDGVEYIFCRTSDENIHPNLIQTGMQAASAGVNSSYYTTDNDGLITQWRTISSKYYNQSSAEYLPIGYQSRGYPNTNWTDDPTGVDGSYKCEWVSQRRYDGRNKTWGEFSEPSIWAKYAVGIQGPVGPQGNNGRDGVDGTTTISYKLVDCNSTANVAMRLDSSNNITQTLNLGLKFRVIRIEGEDSRYLNANEISDKYVYYRMAKNNSTSPSYYYYKMTLSTSGNSIAEFTATETSTYTNIIQNNPNIIISFVQNTAGQIADSWISSYTIYDTSNMSVTLQSAAMTQVVQGQNASIRSLVTGQQGINSNISDLYQTMNGIQSTVTSISGTVDDINNNYVTISEVQSKINQSASKIESTVKESLRGGGNNLIMNGNFAKGGGENTQVWQPTYWNTYVNATTYATNTNGKSWIYIDTSKKYAGIHQAHYNDYKIRIDGGQTYTLSFRARTASSVKNTVAVVFHFWNDTTLWEQNHNRDNPQLTRYFEIDAYDKQLYSVTFTARQDGNAPSNTNNLYVKNASGQYVDTGKPAMGFEIIIGSGVDSTRQQFYITDVMLTPGTLVQAWEPSLQETEAETKSTITQTADSITARVQTLSNNVDSLEDDVNDVSVRLDTGGFTINANTIINGQLTINDPTNQGFIVKGTNGNTSILSQSIGTYNAFKNNATKWMIYSGSSTLTYNGSSTEFSAGTQSLGSLESGQTIRIKSFSVSARKPNSGNLYTISAFRGVIEIYQTGNSSPIKSWTVYKSTTEQTWTVPSSGIYTIKSRWTITESNIPTGTTINSTFGMFIFTSSMAYTLIGYDGMASNFGADNTVFFGKEGTYIRYTDNNVLRVTDKGIQKYAGSSADGYATEWAPISGCSVRRITTTPQSLRQNDDLITYSSSGNYVFYLGYPWGDNIGRKVYMRTKASNVNVTVYGRTSNGSGSYIMKTDSHSVTESVSLSDDMNGFISDGSNWLRMNLQ